MIIKYSLVLCFALGISGSAFAQTRIEQKCAKEARQALLQNAQRFAENTETDASISYLDGAVVGDAGDAIEVDIYKDQYGTFKVELDAEMCTLRSIDNLD